MLYLYYNISIKLDGKNEQRNEFDIFPNKTYRWPTGQQTHEKILNIINQQGSANQNHNEYHYTPARMTIVKKTINDKCW